MNWVDITDKYAKPQQKEHTTDMCDWGSGCNNKFQYKVTLRDNQERYLCEFHLPLRLQACDYTHKKIEKLGENK
jgi:hypothetical protein